MQKPNIEMTLEALSHCGGKVDLKVRFINKSENDYWINSKDITVRGISINLVPTNKDWITGCPFMEYARGSDFVKLDSNGGSHEKILSNIVRVCASPLAPGNYSVIYFKELTLYNEYERITAHSDTLSGEIPFELLE